VAYAENGTFIKNYVTPMRPIRTIRLARFREMLLDLSPVLTDLWRERMPPSASNSASGRLCEWGRSVAGANVVAWRFYEIPEHLLVSGVAAAIYGNAPGPVSHSRGSDSPPDTLPFRVPDGRLRRKLAPSYCPSFVN
jgi:hypothetical protein